MTKKKKERCKICGKLSENLSHNKLCRECGSRRLLENIRQLKERHGKFYQKWKQGMKKWIKEV